MALITYLDCSGDAIDPSCKAISVGGFIAHEDQWYEFESRWAEVLREFDVSALHMRDFAQSADGSEFESWKGDEPKRRGFLKAITDVMNDCTLQSVGATLLLKNYDAYNRRYVLREAIGNPYTVASQMVMSFVIDWHERHNHTDELMFVFEKGDNEQNDFRRFLVERLLTKWNIDWLRSQCFRRNNGWACDGAIRYCLPFQASDFICYEQAKPISDFIAKGKRKLRGSFLLVPLRDPFVGEFYGTDLGAVFVVQFKHEFRSLARFVPKENRIRNRCLTYGKRTAVRSVCTPMTHKLRRSSRKAWSHGWKNSTVGAITCFSHPSVCHTCDCALLVAQPDDASRLCGHQPSGRSERGGVRL